METKKTHDVESRKRTASLRLAYICRFIADALREVEKKRKDRFVPDMMHELGLCLAILGLSKEAIEVLKIVVSIQPNHVDSHRLIGFLYTLLGEPEPAIESYKEVLRFRPDDVDAHASLGNCYFGLGLSDQAIEASYKAVQLSPEDEGIHSNLASALFQKMGKIGAAIEKYNELAGPNKISMERILIGMRINFGKEPIPGMTEAIRADEFNRQLERKNSSKVNSSVPLSRNQEERIKG